MVFNFLKKKKEKPAESKAPVVVPAFVKTSAGKGEAYKVMKLPHITEKATDLLKINQYVFKVWAGAQKTEIKKAIESLYGVDVESVKIINIPRKQRRIGRTRGWKKGYKKTLVRVRQGQKIEVLPR